MLRVVEAVFSVDLPCPPLFFFLFSIAVLSFPLSFGDATARFAALKTKPREPLFFLYRASCCECQRRHLVCLLACLLAHTHMCVCVWPLRLQRFFFSSKQPHPNCCFSCARVCACVCVCACIHVCVSVCVYVFGNV